MLGWNRLAGLFGPIMTSGTPGTPPRSRRAGLLRRSFDERTFRYTPTPFAIDRMLLIVPLLGASLAGASDGWQQSWQGWRNPPRSAG